MVNWENETTLATPSIDINRVQILQRRAFVIEALEKYYGFNIAGGGNAPKHEFISRIISLYYEIEELLYRRFNTKLDGKLSYSEIKDILFVKTNTKHNFLEVLKVWNQINILLGDINLTKIDTKKSYDQTNIEEENDIQGL